METIFFYGHTPNSTGHNVFSNFFLCKFTDSNGTKFNCTEQYMMAGKALLFNDKKSYEKIMSSANPVEIKSLGRKVKNFNEDIWDSKKFSLVKDGVLLKFSQNEHFKQILLKTGDAVLAEASPYDKIWGIGLSRKTAEILNDSTKWKGENLLGKILMQVRDELKEKD
jgi:ribA/ribD-fused uncharacterized protein